MTVVYASMQLRAPYNQDVPVLRLHIVSKMQIVVIQLQLLQYASVVVMGLQPLPVALAVFVLMQTSYQNNLPVPV